MAAPATPELSGILADPENLRSSVASGIAWNTAVSIAVQASRIVSSLVLVRLLSPADYGLAGMAIIVLAFVATFQDVGFGAGLIQRRTITEADRSTVFWTTVAIGSFLTVLMMALSGAIEPSFMSRKSELVIRGLPHLAAHRLARDDSGLIAAPGNAYR